MLFKTSPEHMTATFAVLVPNKPDAHGHEISADEIVKTAHEFMLNLSDKYVNVNHENGSVLSDVKYVESFVAPQDIVTDGGTIAKGSWLVAFKFLTEDRWQQFINGDIVGVSMEWTGYVS